MTLQATFTGEKGSLGLLTGKLYTLEIAQVKDIPIITDCTPPVKGIGWQGLQKLQCPYGSWKAFWKNWKPL